MKLLHKKIILYALFLLELRLRSVMNLKLTSSYFNFYIKRRISGINLKDR